MTAREGSIEFTLSQEEAALLHEIMMQFLPNLREEVYKTEKYEWRQSLKADEVLLKGLIQRLDALRSQHAPSG